MNLASDGDIAFSLQLIASANHSTTLPSLSQCFPPLWQKAETPLPSLLTVFAHPIPEKYRYEQPQHESTFPIISKMPSVRSTTDLLAAEVQQLKSMLSTAHAEVISRHAFPLFERFPRPLISLCSSNITFQIAKLKAIAQEHEKCARVKEERKVRRHRSNLSLAAAALLD